MGSICNVLLRRLSINKLSVMVHVFEIKFKNFVFELNFKMLNFFSLREYDSFDDLTLFKIHKLNISLFF